MKKQQIVGENLKYYRYKAKMSQEKFYGQFGLNYRYMSSVERGEVNVSVEFLDKLATILNVDFLDFFNTDKSRWIHKKRIDAKTKKEN